MNDYGILFALGYIGAAAGFLYVLIAKPKQGNAILAAALSAGFATYTAVQIYTEGVMMFYTNHSANLTGVQVWWDLLASVVIALFFIAPRARKVGMNVWLWAIPVMFLASVGLLAMAARLFWLENAVAEPT
ncbi:MAG: hypothetical protein WA948_12595 [Pontixanthobacter sp.]